MLKPKILIIDNEQQRSSDIINFIESQDAIAVVVKNKKDIKKYFDTGSSAVIIGSKDAVFSILESAESPLDESAISVIVYADKANDSESIIDEKSNYSLISYDQSNIRTAIKFAIELWQQKKQNLQLQADAEALKVQLDETVQEFDSFQYIVSHDLRAPLRALNGYSQILVEDHAGSVNADAARMLGRIRTNVTKLERQLDDLLSYSRVNRTDVKYEKVDMEKLVRQAFKSTPKQHQLTISELNFAYGDKALLQQLWAQLASNAVKFAKADEVLNLEVGSSENQIEITYYLKDNGVGFDMQFVPKIFDVFQKLHNSAEYEGNGMGLAVARSIVEKHNGKIWVESAPDVGTTVYFTLPTRSSIKVTPAEV